MAVDVGQIEGLLLHLECYETGCRRKTVYKRYVQTESEQVALEGKWFACKAMLVVCGDALSKSF